MSRSTFEFVLEKVTEDQIKFIISYKTRKYADRYYEITAKDLANLTKAIEQLNSQ